MAIEFGENMKFQVFLCMYLVNKTLRLTFYLNITVTHINMSQVLVYFVNIRSDTSCR